MAFKLMMSAQKKWRKLDELMRWMPPPNGIFYAIMVPYERKGGRIFDDEDQKVGD